MNSREVKKIEIEIKSFLDSEKSTEGLVDLFRFRSINDFTLKAFIDDEIWVSTPTTFNDPYDARFYYNEKEIKNDIYRTRRVQDEGRVSTKSTRNTAKYIYSLVESLFDTLPNWFCIACFTKFVSNEIMWSHYADSGKGFALQYDVNEMNLMLQKYKKKFPYKKIIEKAVVPGLSYGVKGVYYTNYKKDFTDLFLEFATFLAVQGDEKPDNMLIQKHANIFRQAYGKLVPYTLYLKKNDWKYEGEYRIAVHNRILDNGNQNKYGRFSLLKIKPRAIYLGEYILGYHKTALTQLAKEKEIKIFQMQTVKVNNTLELRSVEICI